MSLLKMLSIFALLLVTALIFQNTTQINQTGGSSCPFKKTELKKTKSGITLYIYTTDSRQSRKFKNKQELSEFWKFLKLNNPGLSNCPLDYEISAGEESSGIEALGIEGALGTGTEESLGIGTEELDTKIDINSRTLDKLETSFKELENKLVNNVSQSNDINNSLKTIIRPASQTNSSYSRQFGQNPQEPCPVAYDTSTYLDVTTITD